MAIINNIGYLRNDLIKHNYHMTAFLFTYNKRQYDVLFENNDNFEDRKNPLASVILTFIDIDNIERKYTIECNQKRMFFEPREFRLFFGIKYGPNLGDIFGQFFNLFIENTPPTIPPLNDRQNNEIDHCLAGRGGHNPNAIYCYDARRLGERNGLKMKRSIFISNLTERRKPDLYEFFKNELTVTFYYSPNPEDELNDSEIISNFRKREEERRKKNSLVK